MLCTSVNVRYDVRYPVAGIKYVASVNCKVYVLLRNSWLSRWSASGWVCLSVLHAVCGIVSMRHADK